MEFTISDQNFLEKLLLHLHVIINLNHKPAFYPQSSFSLPGNCIGVKIHHNLYST